MRPLVIFTDIPTTDITPVEILNIAKYYQDANIAYDNNEINIEVLERALEYKNGSYTLNLDVLDFIPLKIATWVITAYRSAVYFLETKRVLDNVNNKGDEEC